MVIITKKAERDMRHLDTQMAKRITRALLQLEEGTPVDLAPLTNRRPAFRLRVGDWRVLLDKEGEDYVIHAVKHRREVYR